MAKTAKYRARLPQRSQQIFLTDGGMETTLIYHDGLDLPCFAAFTLLRTPERVAPTRAYYTRYAAMARRAGFGFMLETPTWRANTDWAAKLGYSREELAAVNGQAVALMAGAAHRVRDVRSPMVIAGAIGPRGDGYKPDRLMSAREAQDYHADQIATFRDTGADMVTAFTLNYVDEAVGIALAADGGGYAGGHLLHGRDRRQAADRPDHQACHRGDRCRRRRGAGLLHGQLRPPDAFPRRGCIRRGLGQADRRPARQRLAPQPCRTRHGNRTRRRRSARSRTSARRASAPPGRRLIVSAAAAAPTIAMSERSRWCA